MNTDRIRGVLTPAITPLTPDGEVDVASLRQLVDYLVAGGVHGIWAAGTNGEFGALEDRQRLLVIRTIVEQVAGRVPVIGNISAFATRATITLGKAVADLGLDGIAATPPFYYIHNQAELLDHYRVIKASSKSPLWVYNIPSTVKNTVEPATIAALAAEGTVVGVKDSTLAGEALAELVALCRRDKIELYRFVGTIYRATTTRAVGAHGIIPGISNVVPRFTSAAWEAGERGDQDAADEALSHVIAAAALGNIGRGGGFHAGRIGGMKAALEHLGIITHDTLTAPMRPLNAEEKAQIPAILARIGLPD